MEPTAWGGLPQGPSPQGPGIASDSAGTLCAVETYMTLSPTTFTPPGRGLLAPALWALCVVGCGPGQIDLDATDNGTAQRSATSGRNLFSESFNSSSWSSHLRVSHGDRISRVSGYRGTGLRHRFVTSTNHGGIWTKFLPDPTALYYRYYVKFGSNWDPNTSGKLPGVAGLYGSSAAKGGKYGGSRAWSARMFWSSRSTANDTRIGYYVYHIDQQRQGTASANYGDGDLWNASLKRNRWYCIEGQVKMNTLGKADGMLRGWVDGRPVFSRTNYRFRSRSSVAIDRLWGDLYFGGKPRPDHTMDVYIDEVSVRTGRVGCLSDACHPNAWTPGAEKALFKDLPPGALGYRAAAILFKHKITSGCRSKPYRYFCPRCPLSRGQMAAFLVRAAKISTAGAPAVPSFRDVPKSHTFYRAIEAIAREGITYGCGSGKFCPSAKVTRGQMAAFLARTLHWKAVNPGKPTFSDVPRSHTFYRAIETLWAKRVTRGCGTGRFCPGRPVTRAEMAIFLVRAFGLK